MRFMPYSTAAASELPPAIPAATGMYFFKGVWTYGSNMENNLKRTGHNSIQTGFNFERVNNWGGFINTNLFIVRYNKDFTISRIQLNEL